MKCMVCELPTMFTYKIKGMEAAFCPFHLPEENVARKPLLIRIMINL
ncbi:MAG: hypothetical protein NT120_01065 [Candidatus Aenigmarchaeota archaeon]|nr:hypothetical protein [Candidatus Aenigmarchaeota archaeon]